MRFGMNLLLWTDDPTLPEWLPLYERLAAMGFDGIELPVFDADVDRFRELGERLRDMGLARTAIAVCNEEADPISLDPAVRKAAVASLCRVVDCCEASSADLLGGPLYAAIGRFSGVGPSETEWQHGVEVIREVADHAARAGVSLALEFLNRFEIYLLNDAADTARFVDEVDRPNVGVHYDTFHAHIEEKDPAAAIRAAGRSIHHFHASENDRSTPGLGQVRWRESLEALHETGYDGWLTIEAFGRGLPSLAAATKIWRRMFDDEERLAAEGLAFLKHEWEAVAAR
jgi:D-psicose/D-tagatose/L-ribulose 3-epimerase